MTDLRLYIVRRSQSNIYAECSRVEALFQHHTWRGSVRTSAVLCVAYMIHVFYLSALRLVPRRESAFRRAARVLLRGSSVDPRKCVPPSVA